MFYITNLKLAEWMKFISGGYTEQNKQMWLVLNESEVELGMKEGNLLIREQRDKLLIAEWIRNRSCDIVYMYFYR